MRHATPRGHGRCPQTSVRAPHRAALALAVALCVVPAWAMAEAASPDAAQAGGDTDWGFEWRGWGGLHFGHAPQAWLPATADGLPGMRWDKAGLEGRISGKLEFDAAAFDTSGSLTGFDNGLEMRRLRLKIQGDAMLLVPFSYRLDIGYVSSNFTITQAYLDLPISQQIGTLRIGIFQPPMGLDFITSSWDISFMEPAATLQALAPQTAPGLQLSSPFAAGRGTWALGMFGQPSSNPEYGSLSKNFSDTLARLTWLAVDGIDVDRPAANQLLHLGLSFGYQNSGRGQVSFRARPESHIAPYVIDTGSIRSDGGMAFGAELAWVDAAFSAQAEILHQSIGRSASVERLNFGGFYVSASWCLSGESRPYDRQAAAFKQIVPRNDFSFGDGGWGALELAARFSRTDLNDGKVQGGRLNLFMGSLNWYPQRNTRWMFDLGRGNVAGAAQSGNLLIVQTRVGVNF